jgi:hypothetical protein
MNRCTRSKKRDACAEVARYTRGKKSKVASTVAALEPGWGEGPPARPTCHVWKSERECSQRSRVYASAVAEESEHIWTRVRGKRRRRKKPKLESLTKVEPSKDKAISTESLKNKKKTFSYSTTTVKERMTTVDHPQGCYMMDAQEKNPVFILIPRKESLECNGKRAPVDIDALDILQTGVPNTTRSPYREGNCTGHYTTVGVCANRGGRGTTVSPFADANKDEWNTLVKMSRRCQSIASRYLPCELLTGMAEVMKMAECPTMAEPRKSGKAKTVESPASVPGMFAALANAINHDSPAHTDADFTLSVLTANVKGLVTPAEPRYSSDSPIVHHFVFPEYGIAIAIRPGDTLIFNPLHYHCLAGKEIHYNGKDVYVTSFYLKTAVVCKNNNNIPLNEDETARRDRLS